MGGNKKKNKSKFINWIKKEIPVNRLGKTDDIANAVVFFASDSSSFINGSNLLIDGGKSNSII